MRCVVAGEQAGDEFASRAGQIVHLLLAIHIAAEVVAIRRGVNTVRGAC